MDVTSAPSTVAPPTGSAATPSSRPPGAPGTGTIDFRFSRTDLTVPQSQDHTKAFELGFGSDGRLETVTRSSSNGGLLPPTSTPVPIDAPLAAAADAVRSALAGAAGVRELTVHTSAMGIPEMVTWTTPPVSKPDYATIGTLPANVHALLDASQAVEILLTPGAPR